MNQRSCGPRDGCCCWRFASAPNTCRVARGRLEAPERPRQLASVLAQPSPPAATSSARSRAPRCRRCRSCARRCATSRPRRPTSTRSVKVVNQLLNTAAYNPPGQEEGFLFWPAWVNHAGNSIFSTQDAHGPIRRGLFLPLPPLAAAGRGRAGQPAARHARRAAQRSRRRSLPDSDPGPVGGGAAQCTRTPPPSARSPRWCFALSCFGLLLFLWLAFGGPVPLKPKGYRFNTSFAEATQLAPRPTCGSPACRSARSRRSSPTSRRAARRRDPAPLALRAAAVGREGDPAPEDAAGRDLRRADAGHAARRADPRGRRLPATQVSATVELDEILRAFDPKTREAFQAWMQTQAQAIDGRGQRPQRRARQPRPVRRGHGDDRRHPQPPGGGGPRLVSNTGVVFEALTERDGQLRALIENSNTVFATTAERDRELQAAFRALPTFERESRATLERLDEFAARDRPADHPAAAGRARAVADAGGPRGARARPARRCSATSTR